LVERDMNLRITQPTKEQVRAYMARRERARRPPPAPEDIRRQLGWKLAPSHPVAAMIEMCLLPVTTGQCVSQLMLAWCMLPLGASCFAARRPVGPQRARQQ
jgi:hypothetical protein